jgi:hypothetical protein
MEYTQNYLNQENDDNPMELGVHYFQTNPFRKPTFFIQLTLVLQQW